jgi:hypothetical protein
MASDGGGIGGVQGSKHPIRSLVVRMERRIVDVANARGLDPRRDEIGCFQRPFQIAAKVWRQFARAE